MEIESALKSFLQSKNSTILYGEFYGKKLLLLGVSGAYAFENEQIFEFYANNFTQIDSSQLTERLKSLVDEVRSNLTHYQSLIERKENAILQGKHIAKFFQKSFVLKQKLNKALNFCTQSNEALNLLASEQAFLKKNLRLLIFATKMLEKNAKELIYRLDGLYTLINSIKSERLNQNIYVLSIISTIVLPLNLIVGFFGMNTGGLFLQDSTYGSLIVLGVIAFVFVCGVLYYRLKTKQELILDSDYAKVSKKEKTP